MSNYIGGGSTSATTKRYIYALRRDDEGNLFVARVNINDQSDGIELFQGPVSETITDTIDVYSDDYFDGRSATTRELVDENLYYEQWRWDGRFVSYFLNEDGEFVASIGGNHAYSVDV